MFGRLTAFLRSLDWGVLLAVLFLFCFGLAAIYSVELSNDTRSFPSVQKQLIAFLIGLGVATAIARWNYLQLRNYARALYLGSLGLLVLVLLFGVALNSSRSWFLIGPMSFQPVELMKVSLVVVLARYFGEHARKRFGWKEIMTSGIMTMIPVGLVMLQPDLGSASILVGIWLFMLVFAGIRWIHIAVIGGIGGFFATIFGLFFIKPYQVERINTFLNPGLDPLGEGYNIIQAKIAIGAGQFFGRGLGFGSQSQLKFLPESQTDFVFAVIAEELGFIGVMMLLGAVGILSWRLFRLVKLSRDGFTSFLVAGAMSALFIQIFLNIAVNLAIVPATGVTLPFVSAGGSSLLISLVFIGIIQSVATRVRPGDTLTNPWYTIDNNAKIV